MPQPRTLKVNPPFASSSLLGPGSNREAASEALALQQRLVTLPYGGGLRLGRRVAAMGDSVFRGAGEFLTGMSQGLLKGVDDAAALRERLLVARPAEQLRWGIYAGAAAVADSTHNEITTAEDQIEQGILFVAHRWLLPKGALYAPADRSAVVGLGRRAIDDSQFRNELVNGIIDELRAEVTGWTVSMRHQRAAQFLARATTGAGGNAGMATSKRLFGPHVERAVSLDWAIAQESPEAQAIISAIPVTETQSPAATPLDLYAQGITQALSFTLLSTGPGLIKG